MEKGVSKSNKIEFEVREGNDFEIKIYGLPNDIRKIFTNIGEDTFRIVGDIYCPSVAGVCCHFQISFTAIRSREEAQKLVKDALPTYKLEDLVSVHPLFCGGQKSCSA